MKSSKSELTQKATKVARKEAKKLSKEGWTTAPGALPIEKQLDKAYMMSYEYDDNMFPKYIMGEAMSIGEIMMPPKCKPWNLPSKILQDKFRPK